jgi:nitrate/TMAO reductase-like tetraheme cytochrome c subunit
MIAWLLQEAQQPLRVDRPAPGDTMTVFHPPPGTSVTERVIRWFFSVPQWVQIFGLVVALGLAIISVYMIVKNRHELMSWIRRRHETTPIGWKVAGAVAGIVVLSGLIFGQVWFFLYSQHNNQFCLSCHTLHDEVYMRFQQSKHHRIADLKCHDCHAEPLIAEIRQVGLWIIKRPEEVGPHAPVPREVCANCHVRDNPDSTWQRIIATAGHSVHLLSDTAKKLKVECLTCHGVTAHRFVPVNQTCEQSGCHDNVEIKLGRMAGQTMFHCTMCHRFTRPIQETAVVDTARLGLIPNTDQCLRCHQMQTQMRDFVPANDPHKGECGWCHNPHEQTEPRAAFETCTNSGCHTRPDTVSAFHRGIGHAALTQCGSCHQAHTWSVKGSACLDCHRNIYAR